MPPQIFIIILSIMPFSDENLNSIAQESNNNMNNVTTRLTHVRQRIQAAEQAYGREPGSVTLIAVSKKQPVSAIQSAIQLGQRVFAENYLQDALPKLSALRGQNLEWHFIGDIQSNKTAEIAKNFDWVQCISRVKIAQRLHLARDGMPPLNVTIQVNISDEAAKSGCKLEEVSALAEAIEGLPNLRLRGLMAIPAVCGNFAAQRHPFHALHAAFNALCQRGYTLDTLSMGMSADMEAGIAEGATHVRVGTDIFGPRPGA